MPLSIHPAAILIRRACGAWSAPRSELTPSAGLYRLRKDCRSPGSTRYERCLSNFDCHLGRTSSIGAVPFAGYIEYAQRRGHEMNRYIIAAWMTAVIFMLSSPNRGFAQAVANA